MKSLTHTSNEVPLEYPSEGSTDNAHVSKAAVVSVVLAKTPLHSTRLVKVGSENKK